MPWTLLLELIVGYVALSAGATFIAYLALSRMEIVAVPNDRSNHSAAVPVGGGLVVVPLIALAWLTAAGLGLADLWTMAVVVVAALVLAVIGWQDDLQMLGVLQRLAAQAIAVAAGLVVLPNHGAIFQGLLPYWVDIAATGLLWLWFVNLFNFMDGIDGLTGVEAIAIGGGVAVVSLFAGENQVGLLPLGLTYGAAAAGFLIWNWQPARLFLGDVGSIPLGYLGGWLLLVLAGSGHWAPALILPLYYLVDASLTLLSRMVRLRAFWRPHREHIYQRAVLLGLSHAAVARRVLAADGALLVAAILAVWSPWVGLPLALVVVGVAVFYLLRSAPAPASAPKP